MLEKWPKKRWKIEENKKEAMKQLKISFSMRLWAPEAQRRKTRDGIPNWGSRLTGWNQTVEDMAVGTKAHRQVTPARYRKQKEYPAEEGEEGF